MSERQRLPNRRLSSNFEIVASGLLYRVTFSRFPDGRLAEVFIGNGKAGSDSDTSAKDAAVIASIALQHGVPLETIRRALMRDSEGRPNGPLAVALDILVKDGAQ